MKSILLWIFFWFLSFTRFRDFILRKDCGHFGHLRGAVGCLKLVPRLRECFFGASSEFVEIFINIFEQILTHQANRLAACETVTREDLMTLTGDDILHARGKEYEN